MQQQYDGPEFMKPYFYSCPHELEILLPEHNVHQGIRCPCGHNQLSITKRAGCPAVFANCESCGCDFKVYANGDYPAGYIPDDPTKLLNSLMCRDCRGQVFQIAVGYEYPGDEVDSTDISWFIMVGKCSGCGTVQELFSDETA